MIGYIIWLGGTNDHVHRMSLSDCLYINIIHPCWFNLNIQFYI